MNVAALKTSLSLLRTNQIVDFDISDLVIDGKRVFRMGEYARDAMPQLKGFPRGGSVACYLEKDKNGKVDVSDEFLNWLVSTYKCQTWRQEVEPQFLSGSQHELVATKVAKHTGKMAKDPNHKKFTQTYIASKEGVLLDGHHGWASVALHDLINDEEHKLNVLRIDMHIDKLIDRAKTFTQIIGILPKEGV